MMPRWSQPILFCAIAIEFITGAHGPPMLNHQGFIHGLILVKDETGVLLLGLKT